MSRWWRRSAGWCPRGSPERYRRRCRRSSRLLLLGDALPAYAARLDDGSGLASPGQCDPPGVVGDQWPAGGSVAEQVVLLGDDRPRARYAPGVVDGLGEHLVERGT